MKWIIFPIAFLYLSLDCHAQSTKSDNLFGKGIELYHRGKYHDAIKSFKECQALDEQEMDSLNERKLYAKQWIAYCYYKVGNISEANALGEVDYYWEPIDRRLTVECDSLSLRAIQIAQSGNIQYAILEMQKEISIEKSIFGNYGLSVANSESLIGLFEYYNGNISGSKRAFNEVKNILHNNGMENSCKYAETLLLYARLLVVEGNISDASEMASQAIEILHKWDCVSANEQLYIMAYSILLYDYCKSTPCDYCLEYNNKLYAYLIRLNDENLLEQFDAIDLSLRVKCQYTQYEDALVLVNKVINVIEKKSLLNVGDGLYTNLLSSKSNILLSLNRIGEAIQTIRTVINTCEHTMFYNRNLLDEQYLLLSVCYSNSRETNKAVNAANEAYKRASARNDDRRLIKAKAKQLLGNLYYSRGNNKEAVSSIEEALCLYKDLYSNTDSNYVSALITYSEIESEENPDVAISNLYRCIEILENKKIHNPNLIVDSYSMLYKIFMSNNRYNEARIVLGKLEELPKRGSFSEEDKDNALIAYYRLMSAESQKTGKNRIRHLERAVALMEKYNINCVNEKNLLAFAYAQNMNYKKAIATCEELENQLRNEKWRCSEYAETLIVKACVNALVGNFSLSDNILSKALQLLANTYGTDDGENYVPMVIWAASQYSKSGLAFKALSLCKSVENQLRRLYREDSMQMGICCSFIALCEFNAENMQKAIEYGEMAYPILKKCSNKTQYVDLLLLLGEAYANILQYDKAISFLEEAESVTYELSGGGFSEYRCGVFEKLGSLNYAMGNYSEAETYFNVCYEMAKDIYDETDYNWGLLLYSQAMYNFARGRVVLAKEQVEKSRSVLVREFNENSRLVYNVAALETLIDLAAGDKKNSILRLEELYQKISGQKTATTSDLNLLMSSYNEIGEYKKATVVGNMLLNSLKNNIGDEALNMRAYQNLAYLYSNLNNADKVAEYIGTAMNICKNMVSRNFLILTKRERTDLWNSVYYNFLNKLPLLCDKLHDHDKLTSVLYDATIFCKGLMLQTDNKILDIIFSSSKGELSKEYNDLLNVSAEYKRLTSISIKQTETLSRLLYVGKIDSLYRDIDEREHCIMKRVGSDTGNYSNDLLIEWTDIKKALGKGEIAVEFELATYAADSLFYYALVVSPESKVPLYIPLAWQKDISACLPFQKASNDSLAKLYKMLWAPIIKAYPNVRNIYFSPIGELYNIPIESLPISGENGLLVSDKYDIFRLSSTRELVRGNRTNTAKGMAVYGDLQYKVSADRLKNDALKYNTHMSRNVDYSPFADERGTKLELKQLPGTRIEADSIITLLKRQFSNKIELATYLGTSGTETSFKALSGKDVRILHIGTHGFYYPQTVVDNSSRIRSLLNMSCDDINIRTISTETEEDKALSRCGLYMTGAQNRLNGEKIEGIDDGVLTAKEISLMKLDNVDLAVLSACDTGTGDITGDGVFGLQRGFKKAGTRAILMSLWAVNDESTAVLMTEFYREWLLTNDMQESLEKAKRIVRSKEKWSSPYYWAPFVLLDAINKKT